MCRFLCSDQPDESTDLQQRLHAVLSSVWELLQQLAAGAAPSARDRHMASLLAWELSNCSWGSPQYWSRTGSRRIIPIIILFLGTITADALQGVTAPGRVDCWKVMSDLHALDECSSFLIPRRPRAAEPCCQSASQPRLFTSFPSNPFYCNEFVATFLARYSAKVQFKTDVLMDENVDFRKCNAVTKKYFNDLKATQLPSTLKRQDTVRSVLDWDEISRRLSAIQGFLRDASLNNYVCEEIRQWARFGLDVVKPYSSKDPDHPETWKIPVHGDPSMSFLRSILMSMIGDHSSSLKGSFRRRCRTNLWLLLGITNSARWHAGAPLQPLRPQPAASIRSSPRKYLRLVESVDSTCTFFYGQVYDFMRMFGMNLHMHN